MSKYHIEKCGRGVCKKLQYKQTRNKKQNKTKNKLNIQQPNKFQLSTIAQWTLTKQRKKNKEKK